MIAVAAFTGACGRGGEPAESAAAEPGTGKPVRADSAGGTAGAAAPAAHAPDVVVLDTAAIRLGGVTVGTAETINTSGLSVTGVITYDANRVSHIGPRTEGRIATLRANLGARVSRGQTLAVLESAEVGQIRADERQGEELTRIARENYAREQRLADQGISSRKELLVAEAELRRSEAALRSAQEKLRVLGASGHGTGGQFVITSPFSGIVVARNASLSEVTAPNDTLFTVADLSGVWIELDVFERDLPRVRVGQPVVVAVTAYPDRTFPGRIVYVGDVLDPEKRTVRARVEIPNPDRALKPGMFARATIQIGGGGAPAVAVPRDAVQALDDKQVVFVPGTRPGEFRAVPVEVGDAVEGNRVIIRSGLQAGARLVTTGAFALRSELAKGTTGEERE